MAISICDNEGSTQILLIYLQMAISLFISVCSPLSRQYTNEIYSNEFSSNFDSITILLLPTNWTMTMRNLFQSTFNSLFFSLTIESFISLREQFNCVFIFYVPSAKICNCYCFSFFLLHSGEWFSLYFVWI